MEGNSWILDRYFNESRASLIAQRSDVTGSQRQRRPKSKALGVKLDLRLQKGQKESIAAKILTKSEKKTKDRIKVGIELSYQNSRINVMIFFHTEKNHASTLPQHSRPEGSNQPGTWRSCYPIQT